MLLRAEITKKLFYRRVDLKSGKTNPLEYLPLLAALQFSFLTPYTPARAGVGGLSHWAPDTGKVWESRDDHYSCLCQRHRRQPRFACRSYHFLDG
jgi:hypothetical protein